MKLGGGEGLIDGRSQALKVVSLRRRHGISRCHLELYRIDRPAVLPHFIMQVRTRRHSRRADITHEIALLDLPSRTRTGDNSGEMSIIGLHAVSMRQNHKPAESALMTGKGNPSIRGGAYRCSSRGDVVDALMRPADLQDRVAAGSEKEELILRKLNGAFKKAFRREAPLGSKYSFRPFCSKR